MIRPARSLLATLFLVSALVAVVLPAAAQAAAPSFRVTSSAEPSHFAPGSAGTDYYLIRVINAGGAPTDGSPITITDELPPGVSFAPSEQSGYSHFGISLDRGTAFDQSNEDSVCQAGPPVTCTTGNHVNTPGGIPPALEPDGYYVVPVPVDVSAGLDGTTVTNQVTVSGGGAPTATITEQTPVTSVSAPFDFKEAAFSLTDDSGNPASQAGSHPYDLNARFLLNIVAAAGGAQGVAASLRSVHVALPPGLVVNPQATTVRCTQAQLETAFIPTFAPYIDAAPSCPDASVIGIAHASAIGLGAVAGTFNVAVYNMVALPGAPAQFAFVIYVAPAYVQISGGLDSSDDGYRLSGDVRQLIQYGGAVGVDLDLWGDPSAPAHNTHRGTCIEPGGSAPGSALEGRHVIFGSCPVPSLETPFLSMPSACSGPLAADFTMVSYADETITASPQTGGPVVGCSSLAFAPSLKARPTTTNADSPSGLSVDLHVPQAASKNQLATANLKKTMVTLPPGLVVNPAGANGLEACSPAQIGLTTPIGSTPIRFTGDSPACPDEAKLGTVEVDTPLLADPVPGFVYIAKPFDNPFDSLLALYVAIDDPSRGIDIKLAGKVEPDPQTGRLTATFDENPQLPFSDFKLEFFGGANGSLRTPETCGAYSTTSSLSPWSGRPPSSPHDDYSIGSGPNGGECPKSPASEPNAPSFDAGTVSPVAGSFSPFVLNLQRQDGSQQFSTITVSPPSGVLAKLAGAGQCGEAGIAQAQSRSTPGDGAIEIADPSCPASSLVGTASVGAGAGPSPYYVTGNVYLTGPYRGAPYSLAIVTPAVAGPFDLGVVVVRTALNVDPGTAQITAVSDPIPSILQGIPLDVRSAQVKLDRASFTLNGTNCNPTKVTGSLLSTLGQTAALSQPFQLAECSALPFAPKFSLQLKGSTRRTTNPKLIAILKAKPGEANIATTQVKLPKAAFIDNSHIGNICTRPDFAAGTCPPSSEIGRAVATTPLLDYPLEGGVYLRPGTHELPDVVVALRGPASQPIAIDLLGKTDSVKGALRTSFELVPDAPVSSFRLELFGGHRGLIELSEGLCANPHATVLMDGQNGKTHDTSPIVKTSCPKQHRRRHHSGRHRLHG